MAEPITAFRPDWVSPPGDTIVDLLEEHGWTQVELAKRTGYTTKHISQLINGKAPISEDTAIKLERVLGGNARFWMTREAHYRESLAREREKKALQSDAAWLKKLPLKDMICFKWIREFADKGEQVAECLRFFGVASVAAWEREHADPRAAFRASSKFAKDGSAIAAWLRQGERRAAEIACKPFDRAAFKKVLLGLRALTTESDPVVFIPRLVETCAAAGVAVVFEPAPRGCPASGATRWLTPRKALLMLSLRHKTNDHLWFSFFHEAGHLLLHGKRMRFIDFEDFGDGKEEEEANEFAKDLLIPPKLATKLKSLPKTG